MGSTASELQRAYREHGPLRLRDAGRKVHPELEALLARMMARAPEQRFSSGDELAVVLRAMIPLADAPPPEGSDGPEVEDPLPVLTPAPPEPVEPLEELSPQAPPIEDDPVTDPLLAPALKRALMGEVRDAQKPDPKPGVPSWMPRVRPRWALPLGVGAIALGVLAVVGLAMSGNSNKRARKARPSANAVQAAAPVEVSGAAGPAAAAPQSTPAQAPRADAPKPEAPAAAAPAVTPARPVRQRVASNELTPPSSAPATLTPLGRAQKQIASGQAAQALQGLQELLAQPDLGKQDRARATKLMGDAEAKRGNKQAAIDWYRKFLKLTDEPSERPRVVKRIQALSH